MSGHGPLVNRGEDFVYRGKAWRVEGGPFDVGGSIGRAVLARRLEWNGRIAFAYGATEPIPCAGLVAVDFEDG